MKLNNLIKRAFIAIAMILTCVTYTKAQEIQPLWTIPADTSTGLCSSRTGNGFGDTFFGSNYQAGTIDEWKDGELVASYDINGWCAANEIGETIKVKDEATGVETEKFTTYVLWSSVMVDDAGNVLANVGTGAGTASTCQNWILLPASNRNDMHFLHIDEFPGNVTKGRVDVSCNIVGDISTGAYMYIAPTSSRELALMHIRLDENGKITYDLNKSWSLLSAIELDSSTNVATFKTYDDLKNAKSKGEVAADTYIRWRGQGAPFTWNAETAQFEKNVTLNQGAGTPGMGVFAIANRKFMVLPVKSATTGARGSSVAVYDLATNEEVASWDSEGAVDYYVGSVTARTNENGVSANIYVAGHKDCFGLLEFASLYFDEDGFIYKIVQTTDLTVVGYNGEDENLVIPESVTIKGVTYSVTSIGSSAFSGCSGLTNITIPNSVTRIGEEAFRGCSGLTSVTIPNSVTSIGSSAFSGCSGLTSVTIPDGITSIGYSAFSGCSGLTSVTIPNSVTSIGDQAFNYCSGLTSVNISNLEAWCKIDFFDYYSNPLSFAKNLYLNGELLINIEIPNSITEIKKYAFLNCSGLTSVTIPNSVTSIGNDAFYGCSGLTSITIPDGVTSIGNSAFYGCSGLTSVTIPNSVTSIGSSAFYYCSGLTSVTIPNSVTSIGSSAFSGCSGLTSVTIPDGVTGIGSSAFYYCSGLTSVTIGNSVTSIGDYAFSGCSGLTSVTIPNSITSIGKSTFSGCSGLTSVVFNAENCTKMGDYYSPVFRDCTNLTSITIGDKVKNIPDYAFYYCSNLTSVVFNAENCATMGSSSYSVFRDCTNLTSITIGDKVKNIPDYAFSYCNGLTSVTIPESVTSIGSYAFYGCSGLTSVVFNAENCATMGSSSYPVFRNCANLASITIGDKVKNIPDYAFSYCNGLTSVTIPESVTSIGSYAFYGCSGLTSVVFNAENCTTMGSYSSPVFRDCTNLTSITIGDKVKNIPSYAFDGCYGLTSVNISDLEAWCKIDFSNHYSNPLYYAKNLYLNGELLTNIEIPNSITEIKKYAFLNCSSLTSVNIPNSVTGIGPSAFSGCSSLTKVEITDINSWCKIHFGNETDNPLYYAGKLYMDSTLVTDISIENIEEIKPYAFYNLTTLKYLTIDENVSKIGDKAFYGNKNIRSITCKATTPPACGTDVFNSVKTEAVTLTVPKESVSLYEIADTWMDFWNIIGDDLTGIKDILIDDTEEADYYNLQGVKVVNPSSGLYIKKQGNKVTKVVL